MELTPELIKNLSKEQLEFLTELGDLAGKEAALTEKIESNRRMAEKAGLGRDREVARSLMEDQDFDNLISIQLIYEREQVKAKIKSVLALLIQAGLGELGIVKRQIDNYNVEVK